MKKLITAAVLAAMLSITVLGGCTTASGKAYSSDESTAVSAAEESSKNSCCREESEKSGCCKDKSEDSSHIPDCCNDE